MADKWISGAIKHPGATTAAAKREGVSNSEYEQEHKHDSGKAGQRARRALTLRKFADGGVIACPHCGNELEYGGKEAEGEPKRGGARRYGAAEERTEHTNASTRTPMCQGGLVGGRYGK